MNVHQTGYPIPLDEEERLRMLWSYGILDTPTDEAFDRISGLAARLFDVPIALVSLVDRDRQFIKSCFGLNVQETPRDVAFCAHTIISKEPIVIDDASKDRRFADNPFVKGDSHIRFYAGIPLKGLSEGSAIGSFCIIDRKPRTLSGGDLRNLQDLAKMVEDEIKLHERRKAAIASKEDYRRLYNVVSSSFARLRDCLSHSVAHELRTPLNGILGLTELLKSGWKNFEDEEIGSILLGIHRSSLRMKRSVANVCTQMELEMLTSDPDKKIELFQGPPVAVEELAGGISAEIANEKMRADDLVAEIEPALLRIPENYLSKILAELIDNAFKFSKSPERVSIKGMSAAGEYILSVSDEGIGIAEERLKYIGDYIQFDRKKFEQQGLGLGLSITLKICRMLNIDLAFKNGATAGLQVELKFPASFIR